MAVSRHSPVANSVLIADDNAIAFRFFPGWRMLASSKAGVRPGRVPVVGIDVNWLVCDDGIQLVTICDDVIAHAASIDPFGGFILLSIQADILYVFNIFCIIQLGSTHGDRTPQQMKMFR